MSDTGYPEDVDDVRTLAENLATPERVVRALRLLATAVDAQEEIICNLQARIDELERPPAEPSGEAYEK